jgi:rubrerythrin
MITKQDFLDYLEQIEIKVIKIEKFYKDLFSQVNDLDMKEMFLRLQSEEKIHLDLVNRLKEIFQTEWKE